MKTLNLISSIVILAGLLITTGSAIVLAAANDWGSFAACYIGLAIIAAGGLGYKLTDK